MYYDEIIAQNQSWIDETWAKIEKKATAAAIKGRNKVPYTTDAEGNHTDKSKDPHMWTNGFWGAYMWLMYEATKNEEFALTARNCEAVMDKCFDDMDILHHAKTLGIIEVDSMVWKKLTIAEKKWVESICDEKLENYYKRISLK